MRFAVLLVGMLTLFSASAAADDDFSATPDSVAVHVPPVLGHPGPSDTSIRVTRDALERVSEPHHSTAEGHAVWLEGPVRLHCKGASRRAASEEGLVSERTDCLIV